MGVRRKLFKRTDEGDDNIWIVAEVVVKRIVEV